MGEKSATTSLPLRMIMSFIMRKGDQRMNQYFLSVAAALDLDEIWDFIAQDNIDAADRWINKLRCFHVACSRSGDGA
jgi:hypothetical protein